jgi:two-component system response regulator (stage 0 sporulation protein F)
MKSFPSAEANVLLVDDNRDGLIVRRALLEEQGYQVEMARNGEEGLKLFELSRFDVVVTDYRMPLMNGTELIGHLRKRNPQVRIVLLSSLVEPLGLTEENTGADAVVAKNSNEPAHLLRSVRRLAAGPSRKPVRSQTRTQARRLARA